MPALGGAIFTLPLTTTPPLGNANATETVPNDPKIEEEAFNTFLPTERFACGAFVIFLAMIQIPSWAK